MKHKYKQNLCMFLIVMLIAVQVSVPQLVSAEKQYVKEVIYFEDFNNVSDDKMLQWESMYDLDANAGQWYFGGKSPQLAEHTNSDDKCLAIKPHEKGKDDYIYFALPEPVTAEGTGQYEITFDYYCAAGWCDWFYLAGAGATVSCYANMAYGTSMWTTVVMKIDAVKKTFTIGSYSVPNAGNLFDKTNPDCIVFRVHNAAATGTQIKFDNFKVEKLIENPNYEINDKSIILKDKWNTVQADTQNVDIKLGEISVDFGEYGVDESSITKDSVVLDGGVSYESKVEDNKLKIVITSQRLDYDTVYTLCLDGLKTNNGKNVIKKEITFKTIENKPIISGETFIENEDFEDWDNTVCLAHYSDEYITLGGFRTWTATGVVKGKDGGNALTPMYGTLQAARGMQYYFVPRLEKDTFTVDFDYYPGDIDNYDDIKLTLFRTKDGYGTCLIPKEGMTAFSGDWGHIKIELKPAMGTWRVWVSDQNEEIVYENLEGLWSDSDIRLFEWYVKVQDVQKLTVDENLPKIDNFIVNAVYTSAPKLSKSSIEIYDSDVVQQMDSVSPSSNKVIVDFGQRMLPEDMTKENIYITDANQSMRIETTDRYSNGKYELSPVDYLVPGGKYTVHINKCANVAGMKMTQEYSFDFKVGNGKVTTELTKLVKGGTVIDDISKLSSGSAKLQVLYNNSTGEKYTLHYILAFYKDNEMIMSCNFSKELGEYSTDQTCEVNISIPEVNEEYNEVDIIAWDSFSGMLPVSKSLVLK